MGGGSLVGLFHFDSDFFSCLLQDQTIQCSEVEKETIHQIPLHSIPQAIPSHDLILFSHLEGIRWEGEIAEEDEEGGLEDFLASLDQTISDLLDSMMTRMTCIPNLRCHCCHSALI
jgi:hypothetical protein